MIFKNYMLNTYLKLIFRISKLFLKGISNIQFLIQKYYAKIFLKFFYKIVE